MSELRNASGGFDRSEPNVRAIALFGAATLVLLVILILGLQFYFDRTLEQEVYTQVLAPVSQSLTALHAREDEELHTYRFIDRDKGTVRIPIERAMQLLAREYEQGKLTYPTQPVPVPVDSQGGPNAQR